MLPDKPSELITLALSDLEKCEADSRYRIEMQCWHYPDIRGTCFVCLAGSVMAQTLGTPINTHIFGVSSFEERKKLSALDLFRLGNIKTGLQILGFKALHDFMYYEVPEYGSNPKGFKTALEEIVNILKGKGL